jgi:hypothetical protein
MALARSADASRGLRYLVSQLGTPQRKRHDPRDVPGQTAQGAGSGREPLHSRPAKSPAPSRSSTRFPLRVESGPAVAARSAAAPYDAGLIAPGRVEGPARHPRARGLLPRDAFLKDSWRQIAVGSLVAAGLMSGLMLPGTLIAWLALKQKGRCPSVKHRPPALIPRPNRNGPGTGSSLTPTALFGSLARPILQTLTFQTRVGREAAPRSCPALRKLNLDRCSAKCLHWMGRRF